MKNHGTKCLALTALLLSLLLLLSACALPQKEEEETEKSTRKARTTTVAETEADVTTEVPATEPPVTEPPATEPPATEPPVETAPVPQSPSEELFNEVKKGNYVKALDIYGNQVSGNSREEVAAQTLLDNYLKDSWQAYFDGTLPEAEMKIVLATLEKINDRYYILPDLYDYQFNFNEISASRASYEKGIKLAEEGKYMEAADAFEQVDPADSTNYVSAQQKAQEARNQYKQNIMAKAQALVENEKYDDAFNLVLDSEVMYFYGDSEMTDYLLEINTLHVADDMQKAYKAKKYVEVVNRYEQALTADWGINPSADMTELYTNSKTAFIDKVENEALAAFGRQKDYEAAIAVIRSAIADASSNEGLLSSLEEMMKEYKEYIPIAITKLEPTQHHVVSGTSGSSHYLNIGYDYWNDNTKDVTGKTYDVERLIGMNSTYMPDNKEDAYVTYNLNYEYGVLTGVVFRPYNSLSCNFQWSSGGYLLIYGDGAEIYRSPEITQNDYDSIPVNLDVSGVRNLKIVLVGAWREDSYDCKGKVAFGNVMLQKRIADKHVVSTDIIITEQPMNITATADSNVTFSIAAAGSGLTYKWEYSKDGGKTWGNWGSDTTTCEVEAYSRRDGYLFRCVVSNNKKESVTSKIVKLTVK